MVAELWKGVHCVDLGESFQNTTYLQQLALIQPRTSPVKFARSLAVQQPSRAQHCAWLVRVAHPSFVVSVASPDSSFSFILFDLAPANHIAITLLNDFS